MRDKKEEGLKTKDKWGKNRVISCIVSVLICILVALGAFTIHSVFKIPKKPENILNYLKEIEDYKVDLEFTFENEKQVEKQDMKLYHLKGSGYRFELKSGRIMIYKDNEIIVKDRENKREYNTDKEFDSLYKYAFLEEYIDYVYSEEKTRMEKVTMDNIPCIKVSLNLHENNDNIYKGELYINEETKSPYKLEIKNKDKKKTVTVKYNKFIINNKLDDKLFK